MIYNTAGSRNQSNNDICSQTISSRNSPTSTMDFVTISRHSSVNADSAPESLSQHNASVRSPIRYAKLGASLHHVYQQAKAISDLRDCDCQNTHLSKLPPEDLKARGDLLPLMGSSVILEYQGATGDAASIHEVGRMVQDMAYEEA